MPSLSAAGDPSPGGIGEVVKLIQDIAGQTNLLALNATHRGAQNVKSAAETLGVRTEQLRGQVDDFLATIRAA